MNSTSYNISIIIIGYNTLSTLANTIDSINHLNIENQNIEIVYIDDGSTDGSLKYFESIELNFKKLLFGFKNNKGRVVARSKGVEIASGEWLLFLNSNIIVDSNLIIEYSKSIATSDALAFSGYLDYDSIDMVFSKYLNQIDRGIKKYDQHQIVNYQNFLFSNCLVSKSIMKLIPFDTRLRYYGGEELEWAYRVNKKIPNMMRASKLAVARRNNHPEFRPHLKKLIEFGGTNFILLEPKLQIDIIKWEFLLHNNILFKVMFNILYLLCILLYRLPLIGNYIIKLGLLSSVLRGYYKNKT